MAIPLHQAKAELFRTLGHPVRVRVLELHGPARHIQTRYSFQLLIQSRSLAPAGFMAVLVDMTSMGLMVTKS